MQGEFNYLFENRIDAGKQLAVVLKQYHLDDPVILALPRGGVVVADEVSKSLHLPVDVVIARKIGAPDQSELGIGAISEDKDPFFNPRMANYYNFDSTDVQETVAHEKVELDRRVKLYRHGHPLPDMSNKTVVVIDDGLATGVTAISAAKFLRSLHPKKLILAVPLGPSSIDDEINELYDEVICLHRISNMRSVGLWYQEFDQVEDKEVISILEQHHH